MKLKLGNREISLNKKPYFVADLAANHDGDLSRAKELVWIAKEAGADCAKFQHFLADKIVNDVEFKKIENLQKTQKYNREKLGFMIERRSKNMYFSRNTRDCRAGVLISQGKA